jgi:hypothetical protein
MKRSVRNGLAIAGMAGGIFFLGDAVASAADGGQTNTTDQGSTQAADTQDGGSGTTGNVGGNASDSSNTTDAGATTGAGGGGGGGNDVNATTGAQNATIIVVANDEEEAKVLAEYAAQNTAPAGQDATGEVNIETGSVNVEQNANGGPVDNSGNIAALPAVNVNQTNTTTQNNTQSASNQGGDQGRPQHHDGYEPRHDCNEPDKTSSVQGSGGNYCGPRHECDESDNPTLQGTDGKDCEHEHDNGGTTGNVGGNGNHSSNDTDIDIGTDVKGGDGGTNNANVNTGLQDVVFKCIAIGGGDAKCIFNITTGSVTVIQNANGGAVSNSGNIGSGTKEQAPPAAPKHMAPHHAASASAPSLSSAQPSSGQLAFTGSDVSVPLTVGLLALGAGAGLTLLGRRPVLAA